MKRTGKMVVLSVATALMAASAVASAASDAREAPIKGSFAGWSAIDASGALQTFKADGSAHTALAQALVEQLRSIRFVPARVAAGPASTRTYLTGEYVLEPAGEDLVLRVTSVRTGPKVSRLVVPKPPRSVAELEKPSWGRVGMVVGADGRPAQVTVEDTLGAGDLARTLRDAALQWRFEPEIVDGQPYPTQVRQDFTFGYEKAPGVAPKPCPLDAAAHARAAGQTTCFAVIEMLLTKVLGGTVRVP